MEVFTDTIQIAIENRIAVITLNRPKRLNAINRATIHAVNSSLNKFENDDEVAAVIIHGSGRAFSAGMDLKDDAVSGVSGRENWRKVLSEDLDFIMRFWNFPKPTIAVTHGFCLAAACELAMCCDITIAEEGTYFGEPELKFGSVITAMIMPWLTGPKIAKELLLTADDRISAERALNIGLINQIAPSGEGLTIANKLAERMAKMDQDAVQLTKKAINRSFEIMGLKQALDANLELAVEIESLETPSRARFKEMVKTRGLKAALEWRDGRLDEQPNQ